MQIHQSGNIEPERTLFVPSGQIPFEEGGTSLMVADCTLRLVRAARSCASILLPGGTRFRITGPSGRSCWSAYKKCLPYLPLWKQDPIDIAPAPILIRLEGLDDRVASDLIMPGGVLVFGVIAAAHMPADQAQAQVDPFISPFQTLFTTIGAGCDFTDLVYMRAFISSKK
jgi:hypothetical protein